MSRFSHTVLIFLINSVKVTRLLPHPNTMRNFKFLSSVDQDLAIEMLPLLCQELSSFSLFFHRVKFCQHTDFPEGLSQPPGSVETAPPAPTDVRTRNTRTENPDRCHYSLPNPVGAKTICTGSSLMKLEILLFEVWSSIGIKDVFTLHLHTQTV